MRNEKYELNNAWAEISCFQSTKEVSEYHVMIHAKAGGRSFQQQLEAVHDGYQQLLSNELQGATSVFKRYFLSDVANQADEVLLADTSDCAKSIIGQAPLDGTKIALWVYLMTDVSTRLTPSGLYEVSHGTMQKSNGYERVQFVPYLHDPYLWRLCHKQENFSFADFVLPCWRFLGRKILMRKILFPTVKSEYDIPLYKGFRSYDRKWSGRGLQQQASVSYTHDTTIIRQFRDFLSECRRDSIQVVLVTSPFYIGGTRKMADSTGMHAMFAQIAEDFDIPYLDYTYDELSYDTAYFYNTMHLNKTGADLFSQKVARDIDSVLRDE